jgi:RNA polymerase sporulation-specific sigma factor
MNQHKNEKDFKQDDDLLDTGNLDIEKDLTELEKELDEELDELDELDEKDEDVDYYTLFLEEDLFDDCDDIDEEEIYREKEYFVPKSEVLSIEDKNRLAEENMSLVQYVCKKFVNTGIDHDELFSVALVGYTKAINNFNPQKKTKQGKSIKFSTFAYRCIENEIFYFIRNDKKIKEKNISLQTTLSVDKNGKALELDSILSTESNGELSLEDNVMNSETVSVLLEVINEHLTPKERLIIKHRFGISSAEVKTQNELAQMTNMSQANISKLEKNIIDKIKKIMISKYKIKHIDF